LQYSIFCQGSDLHASSVNFNPTQLDDWSSQASFNTSCSSTPYVSIRPIRVISFFSSVYFRNYFISCTLTPSGSSRNLKLMSPSKMATTETIAASILIVGSGVFGLSTAYALAQRDAFKNTSITLLERLDFPAPDAASIDSSRIIRPDYADPAYAALMAEAHPHWRGSFGAEGRYSEAGLCLVQDSGDESGDNAAHYYLIKALENVKSKLGLRVGRREEGGQVELLETPEDVARVTASMGGECMSRRCRVDSRDGHLIT